MLFYWELAIPLHSTLGIGQTMNYDQISISFTTLHLVVTINMFK